jgi:saccharopine dehydrogenase-like NADP-dependent oxidoreductase
MPNPILVFGAGKIGSLIACLLAGTRDYSVHLADIDPQAPKRVIQHLDLPNLHVSVLEACDKTGILEYAGRHQLEAVVSSLPYYCNQVVAEAAREQGLHYFDLTEDIGVTNRIKKIANGSEKVFIPQCGLAPGFISIVANELITHFESVESVKMRVGALPVHPSNALKYSLTWSTDGLINEYGNMCYGIEAGEKTTLLPLEGYETIELDGLLYEAFNTSGGLGTLADTYAGKVRSMNYKTLRYPGHCEKIHLLMKDLKLNDDRQTLKRILENAIPKTLQDVVLLYAAVSGKRAGEFMEETYVKKVYPQTIAGKLWSAIQVTTAAGICSVADLVLQEPAKYKGFITQESFSLQKIVGNRFGQYLR